MNKLTIIRKSRSFSEIRAVYWKLAKFFFYQNFFSQKLLTFAFLFSFIFYEIVFLYLSKNSTTILSRYPNLHRVFTPSLLIYFFHDLFFRDSLLVAIVQREFGFLAGPIENWTSSEGVEILSSTSNIKTYDPFVFSAIFLFILQFLHLFFVITVIRSMPLATFNYFSWSAITIEIIKNAIRYSALMNYSPLSNLITVFIVYMIRSDGNPWFILFFVFVAYLTFLNSILAINEKLKKIRQ